MTANPFDEIETIKTRREKELEKQQQVLVAIPLQEAYSAREKYRIEQDKLETKYDVIVEEILDEFGMKVWGTKIIKETVPKGSLCSFRLKGRNGVVREIKNYHVDKVSGHIEKGSSDNYGHQGKYWHVYNEDETIRYFLGMQREEKNLMYHLTGFCTVGIYKEQDVYDAYGPGYTYLYSVTDILVPINVMKIKEALVKLFSLQISNAY